MHGGAGTILHLQPLARRLGGDQPFYALQSRGLYGGAPPHKTVEEMSAHYLAELKTVQPAGPYYLAGYCFGTIVAFDMAQTLRRAGEEVELLAMFNGPSPAWIKKWGWFGNQPSHRKPGAERAEDRRRSARKSCASCATPNAVGQWMRHGAWREANCEPRLVDRVERSLGGDARSSGRPVPERLRETYFLTLTHSQSGRTSLDLRR